MTQEIVEPGRRVAAELVFAAGGGRTLLTRQHVPYPFHITRPFQLDPGRPDLATLYLQSASGGLYRGDDLHLRIDVAKGAAAHIVTQAATMVHDTGARPARQRVHIALDARAFLAYTPDPLILFPNSAIINETVVTLAPDACAILADAFVPHDPQAQGRPFSSITQRLEIADTSGKLLVRDVGRVTGSVAAAGASPLGPFRACGTLVVLGTKGVLPSAAALLGAIESSGGLVGVSPLPNAAGLYLRCVAEHGSIVRRCLESAWAIAFAALAGIDPAPRRR